MKLYLVTNSKGVVKTREASNPLTACKKAFRSHRSGHWEELHGYVVVQAEDGEIVAVCVQEDNG